ncbi:MAG TPA: TlpA disulfide reductase family protein [Candidatus Angelobacter sp.]|nr:TlpA disulfide reductase family protein [Candidatus Angelobacter sp.]
MGFASVLASAQDAAKPAPPAADQQQPAGSQSKAGPTPTPLPTPEPTPEPPKKGQPAPNFTLADLQGHQVQLSSLKGKAVLLNFWAIWCDPCKIEMPWLVELQKKYGPQGLRIIGVAMDDASDKEIAAFVRKMGVNYTILKGTEKIGDLYGGIDRLPLTYYIDRSGNVTDVIEGLASESVIEGDIRRALGKADSTATTGAK